MEAVLQALSDEEPSIRLDAVSQFPTIQGPKDALFQKVMTDSNHEVREAAANVAHFCPSLFESFLTDPDPSVRIAAVNDSISLRDTIRDPRSVLDKLSAVATDPTAEVRRAIAKILPRHADLSNPDDFEPIVVTLIVPLLNNLLKDLHDDVRLAAALNLRELVRKFGFDVIFQHLNAGLHSILTDTQWRIRNTAVELLFQFSLVCPPQYFHDQLFQFLLLFLQDPSNKVREYAVKELPKLAQHFGDDWLKSRLLPELTKLSVSPNLFHRQTYLISLSELIAFFPVQYQSNYVLQPLMRMLKDPVHDVVLKALELIQKHKEVMHPFQRQCELIPILKTLAETKQPVVGQVVVLGEVSGEILARATKFLAVSLAA
jgi:HEAT repeat protein